jgi:hypothetical protein
MRVDEEETIMSAASENAAGSRDDEERSNESRGTQSLESGIDTLLAVQLSDRPRYDTWSGEARLALAVVEDAILTVRLAGSVRTPRARRLAAEAWAWLASRDTTHPFAFENLCDYLGLNAAWLRSGMRLAGYGLGLPALEATRRAERSVPRPALRPALRTRAC